MVPNKQQAITLISDNPGSSRMFLPVSYCSVFFMILDCDSYYAGKVMVPKSYISGTIGQVVAQLPQVRSGPEQGLSQWEKTLHM